MRRFDALQEAQDKRRLRANRVVKADRCTTWRVISAEQRGTRHEVAGRADGVRWVRGWRGRSLHGLSRADVDLDLPGVRLAPIGIVPCVIDSVYVRSYRARRGVGS